MSFVLIILACVSLGWYIFIATIQVIGVLQLNKNYSSQPPAPVSTTLSEEELPPITILRPIKGVDPNLYECLESTFQLSYPPSKLAISFCISSRKEPALEILQTLLTKYPNFNAKIFVEDEDEDLPKRNLGPNPKIRNLTRAYKEAKSDVIWIVDCNVWISSIAAGMMIDKLCGYGPDGTRVQPYRFVHQLPIVIDQQTTGKSNEKDLSSWRIPGSKKFLFSNLTAIIGDAVRTKGGRLEEMFMATSHAKFYSFFCAAAIRACVVGKSNMFRRSHLDRLTAEADPSKPCGIDFFSHNICEDQLIGTMLWQETSPTDQPPQKWGIHGLIKGAIVVQPVVEMSVSDFVARRLRWQRVRKFEKLTAFIVEPGIESLVWSAHGAFAFTTLPFLYENLGISPTWGGFLLVWVLGILAMLTNDWFVYTNLHSGVSQQFDLKTPACVLPTSTPNRRTFGEWAVAWVFRELFALPIWCLAGCGSTVYWRSKKFRVGLDMTVHEISD